MATTFRKDVLWNYGVYGMQLLLGVVAIPVYIGAYGVSLYGVYLLSVGLATSLVILEFGSGRALMRFAAEFLNDGQEAKYLDALRTCLLITSATAALALALFVAFGTVGLGAFNVAPELRGVARALFLGAGVHSALLIGAQLSQSMLKGAAIFHARSQLSLFENAVRAAVLLGVYLYRLPIWVLLLAEVGIAGLGVAFDLYLLRRDAPSLLRRVNPLANASAAVVRTEPFRYARNTFVLSIFGFFSQSVDRLVLGLALGPAAVTIYTVVVKPYQIVKSLLGRFYAIYAPYFVRIDQRLSRRSVDAFIRDFSKVMIAALTLLMAVAIIVLPEAIRLWLGTDAYDAYVVYGQLLLAVVALRSLSYQYSTAIYILGETHRLIGVEIGSVLVNFAVSVYLVNVIGVGGVIVGTLVQLTLTVPVIYAIGTRFLRGGDRAAETADASAPRRDLAGTFLPALFALLAAVAISRYIESGAYAAVLPGSLAAVGLAAAAVTLTGLALTLRPARRIVARLRADFFRNERLLAQ